MKQFKPMLAYTIEDTSKLTYPCLVSVKLDGIRACVIDGVVYSRSMKPIRSKVVQKLFGRSEYNGLDGELLYGDWTAKNVFNLTTQAVMSTDLKEGFLKDNISFAVFDYFNLDEEFELRYQVVKNLAEPIYNVVAVHQQLVYSEIGLLAFETQALEDGYEGIMVRSCKSPYKQGRSTLREGYIGKLKKFSDDEAVVIGFEEKMTNTNEKVVNELGHSQRSQAQGGMAGAGTLGALVCVCKGIQFTMGSGFDDAGRDEVWANKEKYLGKLAKFKHFEVGAKDSFRFPIFCGWRDEDDLS